jgi:subtilisin family serine protease
MQCMQRVRAFARAVCLVSMGIAMLHQPVNAFSASEPDIVLFDDFYERSEFFDALKNQAFRASLPDATKPYVVNLASRSFLPAKGAGLAFLDGRTKAYVQFDPPLDAGAKRDLILQGVVFYGSVNTYTYLVHLTESGHETMKAMPNFLGAENVAPVDRLSGEVYKAARAKDATPLTMQVRFYPDVRVEAALALLDRAGLSAAQREYLFLNRITATGTAAQFEAVVADVLVMSVDPLPPPPEEHNATAAALSNVDDVQAAPYNLTGANIPIGIWDGGAVLNTHVDLTPRVVVIEAAKGFSDHATHVAGTILSSGANRANARGMAPQAGQMYSYDFDGDPPSEMFDAVQNSGIRISNNSWGPILGWRFDPDAGVWEDTGGAQFFGNYSAGSIAWDELVRQTQLIISKSSGNDRDDADGVNPANHDGTQATGDLDWYDTIGPTGVAKNVITVGAVDSASAIANFSSSGPADDGRIKPDVVADGVGMISTGYDEDNPMLNNVYLNMSGTSMATPTVSGVVALLLQRYAQVNRGLRPSAHMVKAILVNTARDLGRPGPDYLFGYGLVDALAAVWTIDGGGLRCMSGSVDDGDTDSFQVRVLPGATDLAITLAWTDPPLAVGDPGGDGNPDLINNLDLVVIAPDNMQRFPFRGPGTGAANYANNATNVAANNIDNVEHVRVPMPQAGLWTVRVAGTAVPQGPQNYALVANAAFELDDPPNIKVNAPLTFSTTCLGESRDITVSIFNQGGMDLIVGAVTLTGHPDFMWLPNPVLPYVLAPGTHVDATVRFTPTVGGIRSAQVRISSNDPDQPEFVIDAFGVSGLPAPNAYITNNGVFGDVCEGSHADLPLIVTNSGPCPLRVTSVTTTDAQFEVPVAFQPTTIEGFGSLEIPIRFRPALPFGAKSATVTIITDAPNVPAIIRQVSGEMGAPVIDIVPCPVEFGDVCFEDANAREKTVSICNTGVCPLVIEANGIRFDPPTTDFEIINNMTYPITVSQGSECYPLVIRFTPNSAGTKTAVLRVEGRGGVFKTCEVSGTSPNMADSLLYPAKLAFEPTVIQNNGPCGSEMDLALQNSHPQCMLTITGITISGPDADKFELWGIDAATAFPVSLAPGEQLGDGVLKVKFSPTEVVPKRFLTAQANITFVEDPSAVPPVLKTVVVPMAGEAVQSGLRVVVTLNGVPVQENVNIMVRSETGRQRFTLRRQALKNITGPAGFEDELGFSFHAEYGGLTRATQRLTGNYRVNATIRVGRRVMNRMVNCSIDTCTFNPTLVISF